MEDKYNYYSEVLNLFGLLRHLRYQQNLNEVTAILMYFDNNRQTLTEAEMEYKQKMLEKVKTIGEEEIYGLLMKELNSIP
jgi:hypothetical protein